MAQLHYAVDDVSIDVLKICVWQIMQSDAEKPVIKAPAVRLVGGRIRPIAYAITTKGAL